MKFIGGFFLFVIAMFIVGFVVVAYYVRKGIKFIKKNVTGDDLSEEEFQRMSNKYYRGNGNASPFDDDYFKGTSSTGGANKQRKQTQQRTTRTADGVTIVDNRDPDERNRKIFTHDDGDYVDFTEE